MPEAELRLRIRKVGVVSDWGDCSARLPLTNINVHIMLELELDLSLGLGRRGWCRLAETAPPADCWQVAPLPPPISPSHNCFTSVCSHTGAMLPILPGEEKKQLVCFPFVSPFLYLPYVWLTCLFVQDDTKTALKCLKFFSKLSSIIWALVLWTFDIFTGFDLVFSGGGNPVRKWGNSRLDYWLGDHCTHRTTVYYSKPFCTKHLLIGNFIFSLEHNCTQLNKQTTMHCNHNKYFYAFLLAGSTEEKFLR